MSDERFGEWAATQGKFSSFLETLFSSGASSLASRDPGRTIPVVEVERTVRDDPNE